MSDVAYSVQFALRLFLDITLLIQIHLTLNTQDSIFTSF